MHPEMVWAEIDPCEQVFSEYNSFPDVIDIKTYRWYTNIRLQT